jgi:hypothetical protein
LANSSLASGKTIITIPLKFLKGAFTDFHQLVFPGLIAIFVWLIPESPRWLFVNNKREKAKDVLTKWHGYGNPESPWVNLQIGEYEEFLNTNGAVRYSHQIYIVVGTLTKHRRTSASGTIAHSSATAHPAIVLCAIVSSLSSANGKDRLGTISSVTFADYTQQFLGPETER